MTLHEGSHMGGRDPAASPAAPPFYDPVFEDAYRYIIDWYPVPKRPLAIFIPCAVRKPYSMSPSHRLFNSVIHDVFSGDEYHLVIFGTCGTVPAELEQMYPFAHYHYMLGKCGNKRVLEDFLEIETYRIEGYLKKTRNHYRMRVAYCIGIFREAMIRASRRSAIPLDLLLPADSTIEKMKDHTSAFPEGSLSRKEYLSEFRDCLLSVKV